MTVMTRRRALVIFALLCAIVTSGLAAYSYASILRLQDAVLSDVAGEVAITGTATAATFKLWAERVLFGGIVGSLAVLVAGFVFVIRSVQLTGLLDKLVTMNQMTGFSPEAALGRLGDVGAKIKTIFLQVSTLSEKKSRKISALSALNELILGITDQRAMVVDVSGRVIQVSKALLDRLELQRSEVVGQKIDDLIPETNVAGAVREAAETRTAVVRERKGDSIVLDPVINRDGQVAYLLAVLTKSVTDDLKRVVKTKPQQRPAVSSGFVRRLLRRDRSGAARRDRTSGARPSNATPDTDQ